ncbi:hypothetical protein MY10362_005280 [Beauveria mimosiformis]
METSGARACLPPPKHPDQGLAPSGIAIREEVTLRHPRYPDSSNIWSAPRHGARRDATITSIYRAMTTSRARRTQSCHPLLTSSSRTTTCRLHGWLLGYHFPRAVITRFENTVLTRDGSCRLTASTIGAEIAHFIPRTEDAWFAANQMFQYSSRPDFTVTNKANNPRNAMLMGAQLHSVYDQREFVIIPKWGAWLVHVLSGPHGEELAAVYHNLEPQPLSGLAVEYLFARFAWTVLAQTCFLEAGVPRRLVVRGKDGLPTACEVSGTDCRIMFTPSLSRSKSRSQSPKQRVRDDTAEDKDNFHRVTEYDDAVWVTRGRPRKRSAYQSDTTPAASSFEYRRDASDCEIEADYA